MEQSLPQIYYGYFNHKQKYLSEYYKNSEEPIPHHISWPWVQTIVLIGFVDYSHAAKKNTIFLHIGWLLFFNWYPLMWYIKQQETVEVSTFFSYFIALQISTEASQSLRFKLIMFCIPILENGETSIFCDK